MRRVMFDLETLGLTPGAALLEVGFVDIDDHDRKLHLAVDDELGYRDPETVAWWEARGWNTLEGVERLPLQGALVRASEEFGDADELWCLGASFDIPILQASFDLAGVEWPWSFRGFRCSRTAVKLAMALGWERPEREAAHEALQDATDQVAELRAALAWLESRRSRRTHAVYPDDKGLPPVERLQGRGWERGDDGTWSHPVMFPSHQGAFMPSEWLAIRIVDAIEALWSEGNTVEGAA